MSKISNLVIFLIVVPILTLNIIAQKKDVTEKEFAETLNIAKGKREGKIYRLTDIQETIVNGELKQTRINIYEYSPPDKSRYLSETRTAKVARKTESVAIGKTEYSRENNGKWKAVNTTAGEGIVGKTCCLEGQDLPRNHTVIEEMLGEGHLVNIFESTRRDDSAAGESGESDSLDVRKYWIRDDGLLLKIFSEIGLPGKFILRRTSNYDYDSKIEIIPPIKTSAGL